MCGQVRCVSLVESAQYRISSERGGEQLVHFARLMQQRAVGVGRRRIRGVERTPVSSFRRRFARECLSTAIGVGASTGFRRKRRFVWGSGHERSRCFLLVNWECAGLYCARRGVRALASEVCLVKRASGVAGVEQRTGLSSRNVGVLSVRRQPSMAMCGFSRLSVL